MALPITQEFVDRLICDVRCCLADKFALYIKSIENGDIQKANELYADATRAEAYLEAIKDYQVGSEDCLSGEELEALISRIKELCGCGGHSASGGVVVIPSNFVLSGWLENGTEHIISYAKATMADFYGEYLCAIANGDIGKANEKYRYSQEACGIVFGLSGYVNSPLEESENCLTEEDVQVYISRLIELTGCLDEGLKPAQPFVFVVFGGVLPGGSNFALVNQNGQFLGV
jgi:hypothetical protein